MQRSVLTAGRGFAAATDLARLLRSSIQYVVLRGIHLAERSKVTGRCAKLLKLFSWRKSTFKTWQGWRI